MARALQTAAAGIVKLTAVSGPQLLILPVLLVPQPWRGGDDGGGLFIGQKGSLSSPEPDLHPGDRSLLQEQPLEDPA